MARVPERPPFTDEIGGPTANAEQQADPPVEQHADPGPLDPHLPSCSPFLAHDSRAHGTAPVQRRPHEAVVKEAQPSRPENPSPPGLWYPSISSDLEQPPEPVAHHHQPNPGDGGIDGEGDDFSEVLLACILMLPRVMLCVRVREPLIVIWLGGLASPNWFLYLLLLLLLKMMMESMTGRRRFSAMERERSMGWFYTFGRALAKPSGEDEEGSESEGHEEDAGDEDVLDSDSGSRKSEETGEEVEFFMVRDGFP